MTAQRVPFSLFSYPYWAQRLADHFLRLTAPSRWEHGASFYQRFAWVAIGILLDGITMLLGVFVGFVFWVVTNHFLPLPLSAFLGAFGAFIYVITAFG